MKNTENSKLNTFAGAVARLLDVPQPKLIPVSRLLTDTQIGAYDRQEHAIYIRQSAEPLDVLFCIAHDLRHVWQAQQGWSFADKPIPGSCPDEYNQHPAEIDANAFAQLVMVSAFGVQPLFSGLSPETKMLIDKRATEITKGEFTNDK